MVDTHSTASLSDALKHCILQHRCFLPSQRFRGPPVVRSLFLAEAPTLHVHLHKPTDLLQSGGRLIAFRPRPTSAPYAISLCARSAPLALGLWSIRDVDRFPVRVEQVSSMRVRHAEKIRPTDVATSSSHSPIACPPRAAAHFRPYDALDVNLCSCGHTVLRRASPTRQCSRTPGR